MRFRLAVKRQSNSKHSPGERPSAQGGGTARRGEFDQSRDRRLLIEGSALICSFCFAMPLTKAEDLRFASYDTAAQSSGGASASIPALQEIIVTAEKVKEPLQETPVPITAVSADALVNQNQLGLQDYYNEIPGLSVAANGGPEMGISIRGITTGIATNPTVGMTIDGVPYGSSTYIGGGTFPPDIDPSDLARVEVLRGPQGTLYGAASMGGLINYVTLDPSTDALSGQIQASASSVYNGAELGYGVRGAVNVPLGDTLAVRVSGFSRLDPGYIDNPIRHVNGINKAEADGGFLSMLWRPAEVFSLKLNALLQKINQDGANDVDVQPGLRGFQQNYVPGAGPWRTTVQFYSATMNAKLGNAELTSVTGFNVNHFVESVDDTNEFGPVTMALFGVSGTPIVDNSSTYKVTQELRLSGPLGRKLDYLVGVFYTHEWSPGTTTISAEDPSTGQIAGLLASLPTPTTYAERAGFADLTLHLTDRLDVQMGGRESSIDRYTPASTETGPLFGGDVLQPPQHARENAFTYLLTPKFKVSPDLMTYARFASGYRPATGGTSTGSFCVLYGFQCQNAPDKTQSYEAGVKGDFIDHRLSIDASAYYIDWKNIQIQLTDAASGFVYYSNGSTAKSDGVELSVAARPARGLKVASWVVFNDAALTAAFPAGTNAYGASGDRLAYSSRFSGSLSLDYEVPLTDRVSGFVGSDASYVGNRLGEFTVSPQRQVLPGYAQINLRTGVRSGPWVGSVFVNNVGNKMGTLGRNLAIPYAFEYIQPRTVGLSVTRSF